MRILLIAVVSITAALVLVSCACAEELKQVCFAAADSLLADAELVSMPPGEIVKSGDMKITQKDLDAQIRTMPQDLWPQLKRNLLFVLENKLVQEIMGWEAEAWARKNEKSFSDEQSLFKAYCESLAGSVSVSDDEARAFFEQNKAALGDASFEQVKGQIRQYLLDRKSNQIIAARIRGLGSRYQLLLNREWALKQCQAFSDNPVDKSRASGKPTLVEFGADSCEPCRLMAPILNEIKQQYSGRLNVVFVDVRQEQVLAERHGIVSIPVQVLYDKGGQEFFRHVGFLPKEQLTARLAAMGVK